MANINFITGSVAQFTNLATKDSNSLYFLDNGKVYKGSTLLSNNVVEVADGSDFPTSGAITGTFYIKSTGECAYYNGTNYVLISGFALSELETLETRINTTIANTLTAIGKTPTDIDQIISRTITYVNNDTATAIGTNAFANCSSLETCILPNATSDVGGSAFNSCISLNTVELPKVTALQGNAFYGCASLVEITLPAIINIETRAFRNCYSLTKLVLPGNRVVSLNAADVFDNTPIASGTGYVYVHPNRLSSYKSATNWSTIKNQIKSTEELS